MKNITNKMSILENEYGNMAIYEYIVGHRFTITVSSNKIELNQDKEYNQSNYDNVLDLNQLWNSISEIYRVDEDRLHFAPISEYTLFCILYDQDLMARLNLFTKYHGKGIVVVDVRNNTSGIYLSSEKMNEFCRTIMLPSLSPIVINEIAFLKADIQDIKASSNFAANRMSHALVIKHDPVSVDEKTKKPIYWFFDSDKTRVFADNTDTPDAMAIEFANIKLNPKFIIYVENLTGLDPAKRPAAFRDAILKIFKKEFTDEYRYYIERCASFLGTKPEEQFDKLLKDIIFGYIKRITKEMNRYKMR
jgi:hypothetical protein